MNEDVHGDQRSVSAGAFRDEGVWRPVHARGPTRGWKVVCIAVPGMLFALLGSGAFSRSVEGFAWALVVYALVLIGLLASEFRRWIRGGYFGRQELLAVLAAGGFAETLLAGALLADALVERDPLALVISVPVLLVLMIACDLTIAARVGDSEAARWAGSARDELASGSDAPKGQNDLWDWERPAEWEHVDGWEQLAVSEPLDGSADLVGSEEIVGAANIGEHVVEEPAVSARRRSFRVVLSVLRLGVVGADWIAPVAVIGIAGICAVVAIGGVPKGTTITTVSAQRTTAASSSGGRGRSSGGKGSKSTSGDQSAAGTGGFSSGGVVRWNGPCTEETRRRVSALAFERMVGFFVEVHLEVAVEGCIEDLEGHAYPHDYYVTAVGAEQPTHEPLSFAVQSEGCGGAMVLNAARKALEEVMAQAGPVCGVGLYPRYYAHNSDYYYLRTARGVYFIYRRTQADAYEVMRPGLARAWYHAMLAVNTWLAPAPPRRTGKYTLEYEMWSPRNTERPEVTITFNERSGVGSYPGQSFLAAPRFEPLLGKLLELAGAS
jgi:hypothetical protein